MKILDQLNWVDILLFVTCLRIVYIGIKRGIIIEGFKLIGVLCTIFITLHYYSGPSAFLNEKFNIPEGLSNVVSFSLLCLVVTLVFKFVREGVLSLLTVEAHSLFDKWGSLFISAGRAVLVGSLLALFLQLTGIEYIQKNVEKSFTGSRLVTVSPSVYKVCYEGFARKFFPEEKLNTSVFAVRKSKNGKE